MAAALVGKGQALLELERPADALASFEAAQQADPQLTLAPRIETLRFRVVEDTVDRARALAKEQRWDDARAAYEAALRVSPESAVLYRELASVERRAGLSAEADAHLGRALELDPEDRATHVLLAEAREEAGRLRWRDCQLRGGAETRAIGRRGGASGSRARARRPRASARGVPDAVDQARGHARRPGRRTGAASAGFAGARADARHSGHHRLARALGPPLDRRDGARRSPRRISQSHIPTRGGGAACRAGTGALARRSTCWPARAIGVPRPGTARPRNSPMCRASILPTPRRRRRRPPVCSRPRSTAFAPTRVVSGQELLEAVSRFQRLAGPWPGAIGDKRAMTHLTVANQLTLLAHAADPGVRDPGAVRPDRLGARHVSHRGNHRRARWAHRPSGRAEDDPGRMARPDGRQAVARQRIRRSDRARNAACAFASRCGSRS